MNQFPRGWIILPSHVSAHLTVLCTKKCARLFPRRKTEEERQKKEDERARREFIRQEYLRRKQLKLMEDMDTVIKPRPQGAKQKKQRPKSIHRDHIESPKTPVKGPPGNTCIVRSLFIATAAWAVSRLWVLGAELHTPCVQNQHEQRMLPVTWVYYVCMRMASRANAGAEHPA